jgi:hypothetical protein
MNTAYVIKKHFLGVFKAGKMHGKGSYYFHNGNKFIGDWVDGERQEDHGAITFTNTGRRSRSYRYGQEYQKPEMSYPNQKNK